MTTRHLVSPLKRFIKRSVPPAQINSVLLAFPALYGALRYESQLSPAQLAVIEGILSEPGPGNIIECGVYRAGSTVLMARFLKRHAIAKKIYALDSFEGFDKDHEIEDEIRRGLVIDAGRTAFTQNSLQYVAQKIRRLDVDDVVTLVPGYFQDTLPHIDDRFWLALIDCDLERSTEFCLDHLWPRISDGGYLVVDDYQNPGYPGAAMAADRFFAKVSHTRASAHDNFLVVKK
jgi:predicted O-methyltransferase YrrM